MSIINSLSSSINRQQPILFLGVCVAVLCLFLRLHSGLDIDNYLWAEDGEIFFGAASSLGIQSLWTPYAGYIHLYPRLVAWLANYLPLAYIPKVYFFSWGLAFLGSIYAITYCAIKTKLNHYNIIFLSVFIVLQPNDSEVFFSLTNSQWLLGLALTTIVATQHALKLSISKLIFVITASLTGPFSILITPLVILKVLLQKSFYKNKTFYLGIFVCAMIQVGFILYTGRVAGAPMNLSPVAWVKSYLIILLFGASNPLTLFFGVTFWSAIFYALYQRLNQRSKTNTKGDLYIVFFLFIACILHITADFYALKDPYAILAMAKSGGGRYTLAPYTLIIFSAILLAQPFKKTNIIIISSALMISLLQFYVANRPNMHFNSFARYAEYENVNVPINPVYSKYPGSHINSDKKRTKETSDLISQSLTFHQENERIISKAGSPKQFILDTPVSCKNTSDIAVRLDLLRDTAGWITLYWNDKARAFDKKSIKRYYPTGKVNAQFAFPASEQPNYLGLVFDDLSSKVTIIKAVAYCIPKHEK